MERNSGIIQPADWAPSIGYANGVLSPPGRLLCVAGQVGWDHNQQFHSDELIPQFEQALQNILEIVREAGGQPQHICRMTCFCIDKPQYLQSRPALAEIWKRLMGSHYPAMSMIFVADLLDAPALIEIEATAVIPAVTPDNP